MQIEEKKLLTDITISIDSIDEHLEYRRLLEEYKANEFIRCEADDNYTNFYLSSGERVLISKSLKE